MKKILMVVFIMTGILSYSQSKDKEHYISFSTGLDVKNSIVGSKPTNNEPALNLLYQISIVSDNIEVNIGYENFNRIKFDKYTIGVGYHFPLYGRVFNHQTKVVMVISAEPTIINRWGDNWGTTSSHLTIGGNIGFRGLITDRIGVEYLLNALPRTDLSSRYPEINPTIPIIYSNFVKVYYIIK
jgi:hypothetical protein